MKCMIELLIKCFWSMDVAEAVVLEDAGAPRFLARLTLAKTFEREKHHVENRDEDTTRSCRPRTGLLFCCRVFSSSGVCLNLQRDLVACKSTAGRPDLVVMHVVQNHG
jgi:hypothetical protein